MRGRTFTEPKRPKPKETKIPTPSSCQEVLAAEAKAKDLDEQYLLNRNRDPTTIERMGGPRAVSKAYVDVLEMCARYLYGELTHLQLTTGFFCTDAGPCTLCNS